MIQTLAVELGQRAYPIFIGADLLADNTLLCERVRGHQVMIVSNETVAHFYLEELRSKLVGYQCDTVLLPDGEKYKNLTELNRVFDQLIIKNHTRKTTLIALGGGVITDMTGFAAACYMRGVDYIQVPTTLLAQVDASIGGKTGVNHTAGKNLIGAFYQPRAVFIDVKTLNTLPEREFREGLAEVIKYGLIHDKDFFVWLESHLEALLNREADALMYAITRSCQIKAAIVAQDEHETADIRALLNLGHTFAHAIETGVGYGQWLHGEAVAAGLVLAADLSARQGWLTHSEVARIKALIVRIGLPAGLPVGLSATQMLKLMAGDKKNIDGRLRLVLLKAIGKACVTEDVMQTSLEQLLNDYSVK